MKLCVNCMELPVFAFSPQNAFSVWGILYSPSPLAPSTSCWAGQEMEKERSMGKGVMRAKPTFCGGIPSCPAPSPSPALYMTTLHRKGIMSKEVVLWELSPVSPLVTSDKKKFFAFNTPLGYVEFDVPQTMNPLHLVINLAQLGGDVSGVCAWVVWEQEQSSGRQQHTWGSLTLDNWSPWVFRKHHPTWVPGDWTHPSHGQRGKVAT